MNGYLKISEVSEKWGIKERRINTLCLDGRIEGAIKFGNTWLFRKMRKNQKMKELNWENMQRNRMQMKLKEALIWLPILQNFQ